MNAKVEQNVGRWPERLVVIALEQFSPLDRQVSLSSKPVNGGKKLFSVSEELPEVREFFEIHEMTVSGSLMGFSSLRYSGCRRLHRANDSLAA